MLLLAEHDSECVKVANDVGVRKNACGEVVETTSFNILFLALFSILAHWSCRHE